jgi:biofilm PGA synthesis N-glycosyltransferase PgaC
MNYDSLGVIAFFIVIIIWAFILITTLRYIVFSQNVLVDREVDLTFPTMIPFAFNLMYTCVSTFVFVFYLVKYDKVKDNHIKILAKKSLYYNNHDLCSIIIPARNEESVIRKAVLGCLQQTYRNIEVLVICHNSSDRTFDEAHVGDSRVRVFDLRTKESGKSVALNYGVEQSNGKFILVIDADHRLNKEFIEDALPALVEPYAAVQGRVLPINRGYNFLTKMLSIEDDLWADPIVTVRTLLGKRCPLLGTGFIIKKDILMEVGSFGKSLVDDHELSFRLFRRKFRILFVPLCICYGEHPPSLEIMLRQRARWGKGFIDLLNQRIAEPTDLLGHIFWLAPIGALSGAIMLCVVAYASIYNLLFEYLPFAFSYLPLQAWFFIMGLTLTLDLLVIIKRHGRKGIRYAIYLVPYIVFSQYSLVVLFKAFFVKSWGTTKTTHGFTSEKSEINVLNQSKSVG